MRQCTLLQIQGTQKQTETDTETDVHALRAEPISITYACHDPIYARPRPLLLGSFGPSTDYLRGAAAGGGEVAERGWRRGWGWVGSCTDRYRHELI